MNFLIIAFIIGLIIRFFESATNKETEQTHNGEETNQIIHPAETPTRW
jgi:large-conductance mechanosensitive channel